MAMDGRARKGAGRVIMLIGALATAGGIAAFLYSRGATRELNLLRESVAATPAELTATPDLLGRAVRVRGAATTASPSPSPIDGALCLYAHETVVQVWKKARKTSGSRKRGRSDTLWSHTHEPERITIEAGGARVVVAGKAMFEVDQVTTPVHEGAGGLQVGNLRLPSPPDRLHDRIDLHRSLIKNGDQAVAIGVAKQDGGGVAIVPDAGGTLVVSSMPDEALEGRLRSRQNVALIAFGALAVVGLGLLAGGYAMLPKG